MQSEPSYRKLLIVLLIVGTLVRVTFVHEPFGPNAIDASREANAIQIARNFAHRDMNILHPRIDSRIDGHRDASGLVEVEFPFLPWLAALLDRVVGCGDVGFRVLSVLCGIAALFVFFRIARRLLAPPGALAATALFAANPLLVVLSGSLLPDGAMLLFALLSADALLAWDAQGKPRTLCIAGAWLGLAIAAQTSAIHLVFFFAFVLFRKLGARVLHTKSVYVVSLLAIAPALAWHLYTRTIWQATGLSLGMNGATHLLDPAFLLQFGAAIGGNFKTELHYVIGIPGLVLLWMMLLQPLHKVATALAWYATVLFFYALPLETSGSDGLHYAHAISVAPVCLLFGAGVMTFLDPENVYRIATRSTEKAARTAALVLFVAVLATFAYRTYGVLHFRAHQEELHTLYEELRGMDTVLPQEAVIVVESGRSRDAHGHPVFSPASPALAWITRRGFSYPRDRFSFEQLESFAQRGATHWIVSERELKERNIREEAFLRYPRMTQKRDTLLFDLREDE